MKCIHCDNKSKKPYKVCDAHMKEIIKDFWENKEVT